MEESIQKYLRDPVVGKWAAVFIGVALIWIVVQLLRRNLANRIKDNSTRYKTKKVLGFIGFVVTVVLIIFIFSDKLGGITIALGVAGAGIAFALQEVIASVAGWLSIILGRLYKTGDRVQLGGIKGDVMDIGVLRTTIMETGQWVDGDLYNGRIVLVANSFVFKEPVFNYSGEFPFLWDEIKVPVSHGSNYARATEIILNAGKTVAGDLSTQSREQWAMLQQKYRLEDSQTESMVSLTANDNCVEYTLRYVVSYKKRRLTKTALFTKILTDIEATNGDIKFASASLQIVEVPELNVSMK